jgi:hypothetical protein
VIEKAVEAERQNYMNVLVGMLFAQAGPQANVVVTYGFLKLSFRYFATTANYPSRAFRSLWLESSHIYQGMTDDVSADFATQGSTRQVPNPAPKSAARTRNATATKKAR